MVQVADVRPGVVPGGPTYISWSQVSRHWRCPESYRLSYRTRIPRVPSGAQMGGSAVHTTIEVGEPLRWWWLENGDLRDVIGRCFAVAMGVEMAGGRWEVCGSCGGEGWIIVPEHAPGCMGACDRNGCPVEGQAGCPECSPSPGRLGRGGSWSWRTPVAGDLVGEAAIKWSGRLTIVTDPETGQKVQPRGPLGFPLWVDRVTGEEYEARAPIKRTNARTGRQAKDLAAWERAREDLRWWCQQGPLFVRRAAAVRRRDEDEGLALVAGGVERRLQALMPDPRGGEVPVVGVVDLALLQDAGEHVLRDWKSGSSADEPMQLAFYAWLHRQLPEEHPAYLWADLGEIAHLRSNEPSEVLRRYDLRDWIPLVPRMLGDHLGMVRAAVEAAGAGEETFEMRPSSWCASCDVRAHCAYGSTLKEPA